MIPAPQCLPRHPAPRRRGRRAAALLLALLPALLVASPRPALAQGDPLDLFQRISVLVGADALFTELRVAEGGAAPEVWAELTDGGGSLKGRASGLAAFDGSAELRLDRGGLSADGTVAILPGDLLRLMAVYPDGRRGSRDIAVPPMGVALAPEGGTLRGWAPAGESVLVITADARGGFDSDTAVATADGRWTLDLEAGLDLGPGASGTVLHTDRSGITFQAAWSLPALTVPAGASTVDLQLRPGEEACLAVSDGADLFPRASGCVRGQGGPVTLALRDAGGALVGIRPGDRLKLDFAVPDAPTIPPRPPLILVWPMVTVVVEPSADVASGMAPPGTRLALAPEGRPSAALTVVADAAGAWRADWSGRVDLAEDQALLVTLPDSPGLSLTARASRLDWVDPYVARATGQGVAGAAVSMRLVDAAGQELAAQRSRVGVDGRFSLELQNGDPWPRAIGEGQRLELAGDGVGEGWQAGSDRMDLQLSADADADTVSGQALPGSLVRARLGSAADWVEGVAAAEGDWQLDLSGRQDLLPGSMVDLQVRGADGIDRGLRFPVFRLSVFLDSGRFEVEGPPGLEAPVELERGGATVARGSCRVEGGQSACTGGLTTSPGSLADLEPGDTVLAFPARSASARLQLVKMTAHIDPTGRDVTGQSPAGQTVDIVFASDQGPGLPAGVRAPVDNTGVYDHEVPSSQWDLLLPGLVADVYHSAAGGHRSAARGVLESLAVVPHLATFWGTVEVGSDYRIEAFAPEALDAAGQPAAGARPLAQQDGEGGPVGWFLLPVPTAFIRSGNYLQLSHARGVRGMRVADLSAWLLDDEGRVAGWTAPFSRVLVRYGTLPKDLSLDSWTTAVYGQSDGDGRFLLQPPALDLGRMGSLRVDVESGQGRVIRYLFPAERPRRVYLPWAAIIRDQHASP